MENKEMKERFDEKFEEYRNGKNSVGILYIDAPEMTLKNFIQSEIDLAVANREKEIVEMIENIPVSELEDFRFRLKVINLITKDK